MPTPTDGLRTALAQVMADHYDGPPGGEAAAQLLLEDFLGLPPRANGKPATGHIGRPPGSPNRRTKELVKFLETRYGNPLEVLMQIAFAKVDDLRSQVGCIDAYAVGVLRAHRLALSEQRLALGMGALTADDYVFPQADGTSQLPNSISTEWIKTRAAAKLPRVSLHALRHTHASICIARGMDVLTLSRRIGHASPAITLKVYGHLFEATDDRAACIMDTVFSQAMDF
jgi:hypothetical protein